MVRKPLLKTFKLSPLEWDRFRRIRLEEYYPTSFSEVIRVGLELLVDISQPGDMNPERLVVNSARINQVKAALANLDNPPPATSPEPPAGNTEKTARPRKPTEGKNKKKPANGSQAKKVKRVGKTQKVQVS